MSEIIAALFVETDGCYFNLKNVDPWDIKRDATKFNGNMPVIAHPPCTLWGPFAPINYKRWGGEKNKPGNDGGLFDFALHSVERCGGVLEHPARSKAWLMYGIKKPLKAGWTRSRLGWVCEVWQSAYGHKANKATRLYYCGKIEPFDLKWSKPIGTHQIGISDQRGKAKNKKSLRYKKARETPLEFRDTLIELAIHSTGNFQKKIAQYQLEAFEQI